MKRLWIALLPALASVLPAAATTWNVTPSQNAATIQGIITGAVSGDTVSFTAGTYNISQALSLKCGITYTGPVATPATAVLNATFAVESASIFNLPSGCTTGVTIEYLSFLGAGGIYASQPPLANITIEHNQFGGLPCCHNIAHDSGVYLDTASFSATLVYSNWTVEWNTFGDANSCVAPQNAMTDTDSPEDFQGVCNGMAVNWSVNGLTFNNNTLFHVAEGVHILCPGDRCEPTDSPAGPTTRNVTAMFNDFSHIHRIPWEEQPQVISGVVFEDNSIHDWVTPYFGSFGVSFACCDTGATSPFLNVQDNVIAMNVQPTVRYGYGSEDWGLGAQYLNNWVGTGWASSIGMAWGFGGPPWSLSNNTVCGSGFASSGYVADEGYGQPTPTHTGNVTSSTCTPVTSVAPSISPSPGGYSSPLTVTITDPGYTSGSVPQGNTSIYYTTDGSTPNPSGASTAAQYYLSPSGSDSNSGTLASPWLTPNHAVNCGDTITAASGTYSASNFGSSNWGTVTCSAGNNVAWLQCATFDTCKIAATSSDGMWVSKSYWGVEGWEISTNTTATGACFHAGPTGGSSIHHIVFANNVANGCMGGGFTSYDLSTSASVDYIAYVGNVAWNAAQGNGACYSGFNVYQPIASDTAAGTHIFMAGNISYNNVDASPCSGGLTTDGEGFNLDTFDFSQGGGTAYTQQAAVENNISVSNGSSGILIENNKTGSSAAPVFFKQNTSYGNLTAANRSFCTGLGELYLDAAYNVTATGNLAMTNAATGCMGDAIWAFSVANGNNTDSVSGNLLYSAAGNLTFISASGSFAYGSNLTTTNPAFASTTIPGAPACGGKASAPACMAGLIAGLTPTAAGTAGYGYQTPVSTPVADALFPAWLCNVHLPSGLVSTPCVAGNSTKLYTVPVTVSLPATVHAIGMWGTGANTLSYPSGYGFVSSAVQTAAYTTSGGVTLASVSIAPTGGVSALNVGGTVQMIVTCHYSDGSTSGCNSVDSRGNLVTGWASSNGDVTISASGLATGAAIGNATVTATVTGGLVTSPGYALTVSALPLTLSSVSLSTSGGVSAITAGTTNQLLGTCHYSDGSATGCGAATDSHGNVIGSWNSSVAASASINGTGNVTGVAAGSTNLSASVTPAPGQLGTNLYTTAGHTANGYINYTYAVTGTATFTPTTCSIYMSGTQTVGDSWDCLLVLAPTPTTQASSPICTARYTITSATAPGAYVTFPISGCGTLAPNTAVWVGSTTNQPGTPAQGFNNCGGSCTGGVPMQGSGTYPYYYVPNTFGAYTSMTTQLIAGGALETSQYVTVTAPQVTSANLPLTVNAAPPTLVSAYLAASGSSLVVPNTLQMAAKCHYTSGADQDCTVADIYGDKVTGWSSSDVTKAAVNTSGLVTAVAAGIAGITAVINGGLSSSTYSVTITNPAVTLTGVSLSTAGGVTGLFVGSTNQLKATCTYSDGSSDDCTAADGHGNIAGSYASSSSSHATVGTSTGLVSGIAPGPTYLSARAGSFSSPNLPLTVLAVPTGIYTITIQGPVKFSGRVHF